MCKSRNKAVVKAIQVEVFSSPGCNRCGQVFDILQTITRELGAERVAWREVNVLHELEYAVELGVLSTPAIAIDGELVFRVHPSADKLRKTLEKRLKEQTA
ncbi:MAG: thioredoxin family protein [Proteobacteria bacterium]|nr:thioredoxin family protein [Pseudomonadota bacterium]MCH8930373.1 thioredoxin family protein [Pseudomonadota bacterium]